MTFHSLAPFIPSGPDFDASKNLFLALGFQIEWDGGDYIGFKKDKGQFILQKYNNREFAENLMISVAIDNAEEFYKELKQKQLDEKFNIKFNPPVKQPYGIEVNLIDLAGVCWHFVQ